MMLQAFARPINEPVRVAVGVGIEKSFFIQAAAVKDGPSSLIGGNQFYPAFIEVALLRHKTVTNAGVLDDYLNRKLVAASYLERFCAQGSNLLH